MKTKLAIVSTHPIQYFSPWFRYLQTTSEKWKKGEKGERRWGLGDGGPSFASNLASSGGASEGFDFEVFYAHRQTPKGQAGAGFGVEFE
jgi:hypothetical protein